MTRDEAVRRLSCLKFGFSCGEVPWLIDALVALEVIELDEPKFIYSAQIAALTKEIGNRHVALPLKPEYVHGALETLGMKIVEK